MLANLKSEEPNTKAVLLKLVMGEADAGLVYATDVTSRLRASVATVAISDETNVIATYPIATVNRSRRKALARQFVQFVLSAEGQALLRQQGFVPR